MRHGGAMGGFNIFSTNGVAPFGKPPGASGSPVMAAGRADHARMLAYAAKRRLAAQTASDDLPPSDDRAYWKACAPTALQRATAIRRGSGLAKLP